MSQNNEDQFNNNNNKFIEITKQYFIILKNPQVALTLIAQGRIGIKE